MPTIVDQLRKWAMEKPEASAYTFLADGETDERRIVFGDLYGSALGIAQELRERGIGTGPVLLLYPSGLDFVSALFGCMCAGVAAVPVYPHWRPNALRRLVAVAKNAEAKAVLSTRPVISMARTRTPSELADWDLPWIATDDMDAMDPSCVSHPRIGPEGLALLQYTSGSTGQPKGVMVSHRSLVANEEMIRRAFGHDEHMVGVGWLPLVHDMGLIGNVLQPLYVGAHSVLMDPNSFIRRPARWLQAISRYRATTSGGPNFAFDLCVQKVTPEELAGCSLQSWAVCFNGAEPIRPETLESFSEAFEPFGFRRETFYPCYGLAEATLFVTGGSSGGSPVFLPIDRDSLREGHYLPPRGIAGPHRLVGCGTPAAGQRVRIVDPETRRPCSDGEVGEIWVSGPSLPEGYWNAPDETEKTFRAFTITGDGPCLRTGDLGFLVNGELFVTGRIKDLIVIRGRNHYPQDIERTAEESHRDVRPRGCAAFAVHSGRGERLVLVVEVGRRTDPDWDDATRRIRQAVARDHGLEISHLLFVRRRSVPKTTSGKIRRRECRRAFLAGELEPLWEDAPAPDVDTLVSVIAEVMGVPAGQLSSDRSLLEYGLDSLRAMQVQQVLEERLAREISLEVLLGGASLEEVLAESVTLHPGSTSLGSAPGSAFDPFPLNALQEAWGVRDNEWWVAPEASYEFGGRLVVSLGADLFGGPSSVSFGQFSDRDRIFTRLRLHF